MRVNSYVFGIKLTELETLEVVWQEGRDIVKSSQR
jgi:PBP1b-binding outer membrane lipoprotein LpoB